MLKKIEVFTLFFLIIFVFYCAVIIGSSWDEVFAMTRGKERLKYLFSLGAYNSYYNPISEEFSPGFYHTLAIFFTKMFPTKYEIETFHIINSLFSILTVFGIYKISSIIFNKTDGKIIFLLCFLNPIFFGHMAMNSKDTIIAFANIWTTYVFLRYLQNQRFNNNCTRYIVLAGLTIGLGTGVRLPFFITLMPLFIFAIFDIFFIKKFVNKNFSKKKFFLHIPIVLLIAYLIVVSCWPHVHENIFTKPFLIASNVGNVDVQNFGLPWMLFNGQFVDTSQLPSLYIIINFFYKSPEYLLFSYIIFIYFVIVNKNFFTDKFNFFWTKIFLILFIFLFPTIYFIFSSYKAYDGLRLFLYLIPYFSIIPGLAIYYLICNYNSIISKIFLGSLFCFFAYYFFIFLSLTPFQYTYLNTFIGKFANASEKFENDYWATSVKELIEKIPYETDLISANKKINITFCGVPHSIVKRDLNKLKNFRYQQKDLYADDFEYVIMTNRIVENREQNTLDNVKTCFQKFEGQDIISVKRNGLMLSTLRKKL